MNKRKQDPPMSEHEKMKRLLQSRVMAAVDDAREMVLRMCHSGEFDPRDAMRIGDEIRELGELADLLIKREQERPRLRVLPGGG